MIKTENKDVERVSSHPARELRGIDRASVFSKAKCSRNPGPWDCDWYARALPASSTDRHDLALIMCRGCKCIRSCAIDMLADTQGYGVIRAGVWLGTTRRTTRQRELLTRAAVTGRVPDHE